mgnify:CR=1 FL=1
MQHRLNSSEKTIITQQLNALLHNLQLVADTDIVFNALPWVEQLVSWLQTCTWTLTHRKTAHTQPASLAGFGMRGRLPQSNPNSKAFRQDCWFGPQASPCHQSIVARSTPSLLRKKAAVLLQVDHNEIWLDPHTHTLSIECLSTSIPSALLTPNIPFATLSAFPFDSAHIPLHAFLSHIGYTTDNPSLLEGFVEVEQLYSQLIFDVKITHSFLHLPLQSGDYYSRPETTDPNSSPFPLRISASSMNKSLISEETWPQTQQRMQAELSTLLTNLNHLAWLPQLTHLPLYRLYHQTANTPDRDSLSIWLSPSPWDPPSYDSPTHPTFSVPPLTPWVMRWHASSERNTPNLAILVNAALGPELPQGHAHPFVTWLGPLRSAQLFVEAAIPSTAAPESSTFSTWMISTAHSAMLLSNQC